MDVTRLDIEYHGDGTATLHAVVDGITMIEPMSKDQVTEFLGFAYSVLEETSVL